MAKFLNTSGTNYHLEELIKQTRERLYLISPFLQFSDRIRELLEDQDRMKTDIRIVCGKSEPAPQVTSWLGSRQSIRTYFLENLHAKCYMNENGAIITSMNLYEFSQVNNNEMGIYLTKEEDAVLYGEALTEAQRLIRTGEERLLSAQRSAAAPTPSSQKQIRPQPSASMASKAWDTPKVASTGGRCIRCQKTVEYNPDRPLCPDCFRAWNRYQDPDYGERFCHRCGRAVETTYAKPLCRACYQAVG
ncbi:MAG: hypothetical protein HY681_08700 [Chloroflexi bacterium]|nr:hypothetical protein [Chloroflexota bacterium]